MGEEEDDYRHNWAPQMVQRTALSVDLYTISGEVNIASSLQYNPRVDIHVITSSPPQDHTCGGGQLSSPLPS